MTEAVTIVGVRFKQAGRVYYFDPVDIELNFKDMVVVNTARGLKLGEVVIPPEKVSSREITGPLKNIVRKAEPEDIKKSADLTARESETLQEATRLVAKLKLPMKLLSAEYSLDANHLTIFFKAGERVDFRELVREMVSHFKLRVELRQVGPRDEAKLIGGFGRCGRPFCCANHLGDFAPVSIKMAKEQDLPLNPMKIAGSCGRLLCCLAYESELNAKEKRKPVSAYNGAEDALPAGNSRGKNAANDPDMPLGDE